MDVCTNPVCGPLSTVQEVWLWSAEKAPCWPVKPFVPEGTYCVPGGVDSCHEAITEFRPCTRMKRSNVPRTLFCHDMKEGYLEDRFVNGCGAFDAYRFFHWGAIDTFIYFSHKLLTIPPPVWISAAHLHGVKVLGTLITEWDDGKKFCKEILETENHITAFADKMVEICLHYGFDGWLFNIENVIDPEDLPKLESFVAQVTERLHKSIPHSEAIWYDSVISTGELKWQNELNDKNRAFFDKCDGIFVNYTWTEQNLLNSVANAGMRAFDVYVGVDVFGRGCPGGGGFNSSKALEMIRTHKLSVAIFAAGWVHECLDSNKFTVFEYMFWKKLWPYLYIHGPSRLPFQTSFCQGYGKMLYEKGKVVCKDPWINLRKQQYQSTAPSCVTDVPLSKDDPSEDLHSSNKSGCIHIYDDDAFTGGGCLQLSTPNNVPDSKLVLFRLLICNFSCEGPLFAAIAIKPDKADSVLNLTLVIEDAFGMYRKVVLLGHNGNSDIHNKCKTSDVVEPLSITRVSELEQQSKLNLAQAVDAATNWQTKYYLLENLLGRIVEVTAELGGRRSSLLGWLAFTPLKTAV